ncbi:Hrq1p [Nannizzia gypsea CBS 118893]|uniref:Hrq1p n=1 Tax=Arthroderma gypseum (strain ATCC MYA-4604 / CBS 118893) TaxID=535722 RepID=E4V698_ARTGP|nr:Hrq1p [Nannizzia gypsea CBS 118893]EFR05281.1 Hrq1p [Nannizzia gypsea CBS 118893]
MENQRKRKREGDDGRDKQDSTPVVIGYDGIDKGNLAKSRPSAMPSHSRIASCSEPSSAIPWPEEFKALSRIHRALNVVYTFCCTRQHYTTTFKKIRSSVESQTGGRPLTVEDVARVRFLIPHSVRFELSDTGVTSIMGVKEVRIKKTSEIWNDWEVEGMGLNAKDGERPPPDTELLFEFVDGDLKPESQPGVGLGGYEDIRTPVYSQKKMTALIEKRNKKFSVAIDTFLASCRDDNVDPVQRLEAGKDLYMPLSPDSGCNIPTAAKIPAQIPKTRQSIADIISDIKRETWYCNQIVNGGYRIFDAKMPAYGDLNFLLSQNLVNALYNTRGITQFYSHQAKAINDLHDGHNVIVSTSTSSGKSLIYQVPMLHELEENPHSRGMYIFPTKALAQDQRRSMLDMLQYMEGMEHIMVETFDGDTPITSRNSIREEARIIFTNPDILHMTILPHESLWRTFLKNLKYVVVDELHVYNGLFGTHVALIMRRLRRICASIGNSDIKFISCSATVANPEEHMKAIFGVDEVKLTDIDGSPSGRKEFLCWQPPYKDPNDASSGRGSSIDESAKIFCQLILRGVRVIAFCRIRKQCEYLLNTVKNEFRTLDRADVSRFVMGYRGGYSPQDRRKIEREMFEGKLLGIVATNALELGVDIGSLDAVITHEFPHSISNFRQQSGRAGRRNKDSLSILVAGRSAADQHYMNNPDDLFTKPNCGLLVDLENELVLEGHIQCAAFEMPIRPENDSAYFGSQLAHLAATRLIKDDMGFYHCHERFRPNPSKFVSIRSIDEGNYAIIDTTNNRNIVIEEIEDARVFFTVYEGAIYFHQGNTYLVKELNTIKRFARVVRVHVDWITEQRDFTNVDPIETEAIRRISRLSDYRAFFGKIAIHTLVYGYFKKDKKGRILDAVALDNPPIDKLSKGLWLDVPKTALEILSSHNLNAAAAIHAAEHAIMSLLPTFLISSPGDIRTECKVAKKELGPKHQQAAGGSNRDQDSRARNHFFHPLTPPAPRRQRQARLVFYDAKGGTSGSGITSKAFEFIDTLLVRANSRIDTCACTAAQGCVECVCNELCPEMNLVISKAGASVILKCLLGLKVDVDSLPWGTEFDRGYEPGTGSELAQGLETVIEAVEVAGGSGKKIRIYDLDE